MYRKNSIFVKIFIPVIAVMLLQISIIGFVLNVTGTINTLENAAITTLVRNTENRGSTLEQMMVFYWSNLDRLEMHAAEKIDAYLKDEGITIDEALGDYSHEIAMLDRMSQPLLDALRACSSTGIFMIFLDKDGLKEETQTRNGLYYRDLDPLSNPADNSDIMYLKGFVDIARKDRIQLDSLWSEAFTFSPDETRLWKGFANPQIAAMQFPGASSVDLAYWNGPHLQNPHSVLDANKCITYTRPVFYNGKPVALIGSEVQVVQLEKYFPANDFDSDSQSGYMLLEYDSNQPDERQSNVYHITGSYIRRLLGSEDIITLVPANRDGIFTVLSDDGPVDVQVVKRAIRMYNTNAPFSNEQWALAALGTDEMLFSASRSVNTGILFSSILAFLLGGVLLVVTVRRATGPLISVVGQIEESSYGKNEKQVFKANSDVYEINLLTSTLNLMRERHSLAESLVREERQRYLVALGSAADTFMEYDAAGDCFMLYYFTDSSDTSLSSKTIRNFSQSIMNGDFCHPDDVPAVLDFIKHIETDTIEIRVKTSAFSHIKDVPADGDYYWMLIKASNIHDSEGKVSKIIGTAKEITKEKLEQFARDEASRRDPATKFYSCNFGIQAIRQRIGDIDRNIPYVLCVIYIENFDQLESFYGRVFGGFVMMEFSYDMSEIISGNDIAVRLSNNEFLIYFHNIYQWDENEEPVSIENIVSSLYAGDNANIPLSARIRFVESIEEINEGEYADKPVNVQLDVNKANIVSSTFDLFEHTTSVGSSIRILLGVLGRMYDLSRIAVCSFDAEFGANQVAYQWAKAGLMPYHSNIERISHTDCAAFEGLLDENGTMIYTGGDGGGFSEGVSKLLCLDTARGGGDIPGSVYCCVMRDGEEHIGRVLFISDNPGKDWSAAEKNDLSDIVKIISANISIAKSQSASRAKSEFLSRISHEIRTPMNTIIGMTEIAKSFADDPGRVLDSLNQIDFSAKHLLALINDVLEMSRIESGKMNIESKPFSIDGLISGIETLMRFPIEKNGITFSVIKKVEHNQVIGDEYRLRQVLVNLLGNANKFTEKGGEITFGISQLDEIHSTMPIQDGSGSRYGVYKFSVTDTGIGISPEDQSLVFEAFGQAASLSSDSQHQGTGLGLAISESIVSAMGSKIELDSKPGEGSDFNFTITLELGCADDEDAGGAAEAVDYTGCFKGKRALLVDDVRSNIAVASFTLEETGIEIDVAYNGQQAVDCFFASEPWFYSIIFMDVKMPVMDGITATRRIRGDTERPDARDIPIVAMTANAYDEDMKKTVESGMNGHITKPIVKEELFELMMRLIDK